MQRNMSILALVLVALALSATGHLQPAEFQATLWTALTLERLMGNPPSQPR